MKKPKYSSATPATKLHSNVKAASRDGSEFNKDSERKDDSRQDSSSPQVFVKSKQITKTTSAQGDYISFFKHHYKKLQREHSRWRSQQIVSVIKLLWRKKKAVGKNLRRKDGKLRTTKPISGRKYFRKVRGFSGFETRSVWKKLPFESKNYWSREAKGICIDNTTQLGIVTLPQQKSSRNSFDYMSKNIA